ncbi:hypothetical protein F5Y09DRAFT_200327 [Xylaria sp. FL1042]|nr:hypothetical protein F5Y09DRAFT_200327 [Xylaria sp. FL1042]
MTPAIGRSFPPTCVLLSMYSKYLMYLYVCMHLRTYNLRTTTYICMYSIQPPCLQTHGGIHYLVHYVVIVVVVSFSRDCITSRSRSALHDKLVPSSLRRRRPTRAPGSAQLSSASQMRLYSPKPIGLADLQPNQRLAAASKSAMRRLPRHTQRERDTHTQTHVSCRHPISTTDLGTSAR